MPHPATYSFWGPGAPQISAEVDSNLAIVAYRVGGMFRRADRTIWMDGRPDPPDYAPHTWAGFTTVAHANTQQRMSREEPANPDSPLAGLPTDAYLGKQRDFFFNGEAIQIIHVPSAHSDGDSIVHFRGSDVIVSGDVFTTTSFALFDVRRGGTYQGILDGLNAMLDIAVPKFMQEGGTYIVPGHGRISDEADLAEVRDQVYMIRDRFADLVVTRKMTLPQVMAMKPLIDFERRYDRREWTAEQFTAAVYAEMVKRRPAAAGNRGGPPATARADQRRAVQRERGRSPSTTTAIRARAISSGSR